MSSRKRCGPFLVSVALVAANLLVFNAISLDSFVRADLTRDKLFTLHPSTRQLLDDLDDQVTMKVFLSEKRFDENQGTSQIPRAIRDMVEEFVARSNGRVKALFLDPTDDEELGRQAESAGIQAVPIQGRERDQVRMFNAYIGIVISYGGKEDEKIPLAYFGTEEHRLELELGLAIARLTRRETITIGVNSVSQMPEGVDPRMAAQMGMQPDKYDIDGAYGTVRKDLERLYTVEKVPVQKPIPDHVQLLVLCNTDGLDDVARYHIDQYLMDGGQVIVIAGGTDIDPQMGVPVARGPENDEFYRHYGFTIEKNLLLDRQALPNPQSPFGQPLYFAPVMLPDNFNAESTLMSGVGAFAMPLASSIQLNPPEGVTATVLATTSALAWQQSGFFTLEQTSAQANPPENPDEYKTFDTVGLLEGEFTSYFTNRAIPEGVGTAAQEPTATDIINQIEANEATEPTEPTPPATGDGTNGGGNGGADPQDPPGPVMTTPPGAEPTAQDPAAQVPAPQVPDLSGNGAGSGATFVKAKSPKTRIAIFGSNFFLVPTGSFYTRDSYDANLRFFTTLVERMTTGSKLADLRNRTVQRPSIRGDLSGTTQSTLKWIGIIGVPLVVAAFGILSWVVRKSRRPLAA